MSRPDGNMRQTLEAVLEAFSANDLNRIVDFFVKDCVLEGRGVWIRGAPGTRAGMRPHGSR